MPFRLNLIFADIILYFRNLVSGIILLFSQADFSEKYPQFPKFFRLPFIDKVSLYENFSLI